MQELKARRDMDPAYQWDLTHIYQTKEDWEKAYKEAEGMIPEIGALRAGLGASAKALEESLLLIDRISEKVDVPVGLAAYFAALTGSVKASWEASELGVMMKQYRTVQEALSQRGVVMYSPYKVTLE